MADISANTYHHPAAAAGCIVQVVGTGIFSNNGFTEGWLNIGEEGSQVQGTKMDLKTDICN